jgi:hypothetical protein
MPQIIRDNEGVEEKDARMMEDIGSPYCGDSTVIVECRMSEM